MDMVAFMTWATALKRSQLSRGIERRKKRYVFTHSSLLV
jgi:hypothetical protein